MPKTVSRLTEGLHVMLSPATKDALDQAADRVDRPSSSLARAFIRRGLERDGQVAAAVKAHLSDLITAQEAMTKITLALLDQDRFWSGDGDGDV